MNFVINGTYHSHKVQERAKKDGSGTFFAGDVLIEIDNSYQNNQTGEQVLKLDLVPFNCFGKVAEKVAKEYKMGEKVRVTFQLEGQSYSKDGNEPKQFPRIKGVFVNRLDEQAKATTKPQEPDIPF